MTQPTPASSPPIERTEQASRIAAMLERWRTEEVSDEPDWDVDALERTSFASKSEASGATRGS